MDGWRQAIGHRGGGESSWGRAAAGIDSTHDQLTLFREAEVTAGIRRHTAQLQDRQEEQEVQVVQEEEQEEKQIMHYVPEMYSGTYDLLLSEISENILLVRVIYKIKYARSK